MKTDNQIGWNSGTKYDNGYKDGYAQARQELKKKVEGKKFRHTLGGYRQKGELGTATNISVCKGYNEALSDILTLLEEEKEEK